MKQWKLAYELLSRFNAPVIDNYYKLRCFPRESAVQRVVSMDYGIEASSWHKMGKDAFGNTFCDGSCMEPHDEFRVSVDAVVERDPGPEPEALAYIRLGLYRADTFLTAMGDELSHFYSSLRFSSDGSSWRRAGDIMSGLRDAFAYQSGVTGFDTTAEAAFRLGHGVCQDYAHIFLALCRHAGMTARYVAGIIPGEGATHAWVDVYEDGFWKGFDPTHGRETDESYIAFSTGTDAGMCVLNRGVFKKGMEISQQVHVTMHEV